MVNSPLNDTRTLLGLAYIFIKSTPSAPVILLTDPHATPNSSGAISVGKAMSVFLLTLHAVVTIICGNLQIVEINASKTTERIREADRYRETKQQISVSY